MKQFFKKVFLSSVLLIITINAQAFTDMKGNKDDISNHIGKDKWTIVEIWESNCHMCRIHMPDLVKFDGKLKNTRILGISLDGQAGVEAAEDFIAEYDIKFPTMLTNPIEMNIWMQQNLGEPLIGTPTFMLFNPSGELVAAQPGVVSVESLETFITENSKPAKTIATKNDEKSKSTVQTKNEQTKSAQTKNVQTKKNTQTKSTSTTNAEYIFDEVSN